MMMMRSCIRRIRSYMTDDDDEIRGIRSYITDE